MLSPREPSHELAARAPPTSPAGKGSRSGPSGVHAQAAAGRLLLVDDDPTYLEALTGALEALGFEVELSDSGEAALRRFEPSSPAGGVPDCVLLDRQMPGLCGERTCLGIRALHTEVPIIMVTSPDEPDAIIGALAVGADDFVAKGDAIEVLAARVRAQLRRAQQRKELSETRDLLNAVLSSVPDAVVALNGHGVVTVANDAAAALSGTSPVGAPFDEWAARLGLVHVAGTHAALLSGADLSRAEHERVELLMPDGEGGHKHQLLSARPIRELVGPGRVAVLRDVSCERVAQRQLQLSERMATLGMLAAGVGHEINNPLASVMVNVGLLEQDCASLPVDLRATVQEVRIGVDRIREVARELRVLVQEPQRDLSSSDVNRVIELSTRLARNEIMHRARLRKDLGEVPTVVGPESRLGQVLLNLLLNAAQAIPSGHAEENEICVTSRVLADGSAVVVDVRDTGQGIAKEHLNLLFAPFFTTKGSGGGTGLGLSICHRIVSELGGSLSVESEVGKGSRFRVTLPTAPAASGERVAGPVQELASSTRLRVMFVDDNLAILRAFERSLGRTNDVVVESSAAGALMRLEKGERFDAIVCDVMMPVMTGIELHRHALEIDPDQAARMVFFTGGLTDLAVQAALGSLPNRRLDKPVDLQMLSRVISEVARNRRQ